MSLQKADRPPCQNRQTVQHQARQVLPRNITKHHKRAAHPTAATFPPLLRAPLPASARREGSPSIQPPPPPGYSRRSYGRAPGIRHQEARSRPRRRGRARHPSPFEGKIRPPPGAGTAACSLRGGGRGRWCPLPRLLLPPRRQRRSSGRPTRAPSPRASTWCAGGWQDRWPRPSRRRSPASPSCTRCTAW